MVISIIHKPENKQRIFQRGCMGKFLFSPSPFTNAMVDYTIVVAFYSFSYCCDVMISIKIIWWAKYEQSLGLIRQLIPGDVPVSRPQPSTEGQGQSPSAN